MASAEKILLNEPRSPQNQQADSCHLSFHKRSTPFSHRVRNYFAHLGLIILLLSFVQCGGGNSNPEQANFSTGVMGPNVWGSPDTFRGAGIVNDPQFLIGGPLALGKTGDILIQNDLVRFIIRKPGRMAGLQTYGGNIIDADRFRPSTEGGHDHFGFVYPLVNIAWTTHCQLMEIVNADFNQGPVVVRCHGGIDVYDYIMTSVIEMFTAISVGQPLFYDDRFRDVLNPFSNIAELRSVSANFTTDYILFADQPYVRIDTTLENLGEEDVPFPFGDWVNGSGATELFVPNKGFDSNAQIDRNPGLVFGAIQNDIPVSYGYFFDLDQFSSEDGELHRAAAMSVSGVTIMVLGEDSLLNLLPLNESSPKIRNLLKPGKNTFTRYLAVGEGSVASVLDAGYEAVGVSTWNISGQVKTKEGHTPAKTKVLVLNQAETESKQTVVTVAFTDEEGRFTAKVPSGTYPKDQLYGSGQYFFEVYLEGHHHAGSEKAGTCNSGVIDQENLAIKNIECTLGSSGTVQVSAECDGQPCPARVTIVGFDPSDLLNQNGVGRYGDVLANERPFGVIDVLYIDPFQKLYPKGNPRVLESSAFRLEPGHYAIYFTRGPEYSVDSHFITVTSGGGVELQGSLQRVVKTPGYVSGDFHVHGINSPDSPFPRPNRIRAIMAEGLDTAAITDHEFVSDYQPLIQQLGYANWLLTIPGDEITPFSYGHTVVWPLQPDLSQRANGAYDYTYLPGDETPEFDFDINQNMDEIFAGVQATNPAPIVRSVAHITDPILGNYAIMGLVTTQHFDDVEALSTYRDPVMSRLAPNSHDTNHHQSPYPIGTSSGIGLNFTSMGLTIGTWDDSFQHLEEISLPTFFNWLNLGKKVSATSNSDGHYQIGELVGVPRNYVASSVDPRDGMGHYSEIDPYELAKNVNEGKVIVSNGIFIDAKLSAENQAQTVTVGETLTGSTKATLDLKIISNEYLDWDQVRVFANTVPEPYLDDMSGPWVGTARDFHTTTSKHQTRYLIEPIAQFTKGGDSEEKLIQETVNGIRQSKLSIDLNFNEDTWLLVLVNGSNGNTYSTFPLVTRRADQGILESEFLDTLKNDRIKVGGTEAFAFTNPIYIDIDGDGFESLYIADGTSPLLKF